MSDNPKTSQGALKIQAQLVPPVFHLEVAKALEEGAAKYGPYNWRRLPVDNMTYIGAMYRHLAAYLDGEDWDPESTSGKHHLAGIGACCAILLDALTLGNLIDGRPAPGMARLAVRKPFTMEDS